MNGNYFCLNKHSNWGTTHMHGHMHTCAHMHTHTGQLYIYTNCKLEMVRSLHDSR